MKNLRKHKNLFCSVILFAILCLLTYLAIVFAIKEFNPVRWDENVRLVYTIALLVYLMFIIASNIKYYEDSIKAVIFTIFLSYIIMFGAFSFMLLNLDIMSWDWEYRLCYLFIPLFYFVLTGFIYQAARTSENGF